MNLRWSHLSLLLIAASIGACGQKGPLFLPGDPSSVTPAPADDTERDGEDEEQEP